MPVSVDISGLLNSLKAVEFSETELVQVEGAGARIIINYQKLLVPKDTRATQLSIRSHYSKITKEQIVDEIGAETEYAPVIEYGDPTNPAYPIQSFVRPAAQSGFTACIRAIGETAGKVITGKWI